VHEAAPEDLDVADLVRSTRALTWRAVGIERNASEMAMARRSFDFWLRHQARGQFRDPAGWQLQNMLLVSGLVTHAAELRTASVGTHTRSDSTGAVDPDHHVLVRVDDSKETP
jgi:L-aspartate oxidase